MEIFVLIYKNSLATCDLDTFICLSPFAYKKEYKLV